MTVFDPLGLISCYTVHGKILIQDIWRAGTAWDEEISDNLKSKWQRWVKVMQSLDQIFIPRCFLPKADITSLEYCELHTFVDASEAAYACVMYLRCVFKGHPNCSLVASKTKVAPLKPLSIPKLELQAALIGVRLTSSVRDALTLPIKRKFFWTDSTTVLSWLHSDSRRYHQFVGFRVGEILSLSEVTEWRYVPSNLNPADCATRWKSGADISPMSSWFVGPTFLYNCEHSWPKCPILAEEKIELRKIFLHEEIVPIIDLSRFSSWERLLRTVCFVYRFTGILRRGKRHRTNPTGLITQEEFQKAEIFLWRLAQTDSFPDEYRILQKLEKPGVYRGKLSRCSPLYKLTVFLDGDGVIRLGGRIGAAPHIPYEAKYPIILPKTHTVTSLIISRYHKQFLHANHETIVNEIRQRFWIPSLRSIVRRVTKDCQYCRVYKAVPQQPQMGPLPKVRLTPFIRPFTFTGVDYFGPVQVKVGRSLAKRWIALFTCLTVQAVHLEVVHSLSTSSCIKAIRRFVIRRGAPQEIYSDNGTNFIGASRLLMDQMRVINAGCAQSFTSARTKWFFNPPATPHMGGAWERMVRSVKTAMAAIANSQRHPDDETLETIILEAEGVVNSRPLTYVPLESAEAESLTPSHFLLYGSSGITQPPTDFSQSGPVLRDSWKLAQHLVDEFWRRWIKEYVPMLTRRTKWFDPVRPIQEGDLVLVIDDSKRNLWERGIVRDVITGKDGQVRSAVVQTTSGIKRRSAVRLALLEVAKKCNEPEDGVASFQLHGEGDVAEVPRSSSIRCN
ncbi:uncharacterized protein LOC131427913 [Malaya genurostris]|uniref:uncharacterized protein LOC131427913 n=1 Tax=Malaya genurostris TaxID=325434 RepID=UPI0026F4051D|nr:uncharacterized protein LOC131427913 [Malaya genurostris]